VWYRKRNDVTALYVAKQCGIAEDYKIVGEVVHADDLEVLRVQLFGVSTDTIDMLFSPTEI
jgi:hypothetical protein